MLGVAFFVCDLSRKDDTSIKILWNEYETVFESFVNDANKKDPKEFYEDFRQSL